MESGKYPASMRLMHWVVGLAVIGLLAVGLFMSGLEDGPLKSQLYPLHKSFGLLVLLLVIVRLVIRINKRGAIPALPAGLKAYEARLAKGSQHLMYLCTLVMPLSGYTMSATHPKSSGVEFFGMALPQLLDKSKSVAGIAHEIHEVTAWILIVTIVLHLAGAAKHRWYDPPGNDVLGRML